MKEKYEVLLDEALDLCADTQQAPSGGPKTLEVSVTLETSGTETVSIYAPEGATLTAAEGTGVGLAGIGFEHLGIGHGGEGGVGHCFVLLFNVVFLLVFAF